MKNSTYKSEIIERFLSKRDQREFDEKYEAHNLRAITRSFSELLKQDPDNQIKVLNELKKAKKK